MKPLIGVFTSERHASGLPSQQRVDACAPARELRLGLPYLRAVEAGGGLPVVLAPDAPAHALALLERLDGLCLAGGPDLDPLAYGACERHARLGPTDRTVDTAELAMARAADARGLPVLGVCRGAQALNVTRGGTLRQHVDGHRQSAPAETPFHPVLVAAGSRLAALIGSGERPVNSFHHQAAGRLGADLVASAHAPDGTIEALEDPAHPFLVGVQWHAEGMLDRPEQVALFAGLVAAATAPRVALAA